ncbi:aldo/keto reductase [Actinoplanes sp. NPDC051411]|uniref:aldo/keto reductase n=1 Tax=Actinoplanes sp. NPDC051411 TaxID=3155522 RepID=UPI00344372BC
MQYTKLGSSGAVVSRFALGTMTFGSATDKDEAHQQLSTFLDAGGTLIDTADIYTDGTSEEIVGAWLQSLDEPARSQVFLAGKARFPVGVTARDAGLSRRHLRRALDASLTRLGVDHIDLYQLHAWDPLTPIEESLDFLADAVRLGKISYAGVSNFTGWQTATAAAYARGRLPLVSAQPQYNLLTREVEWEILPASEAAGLAVLPWSPLGGGWLTGKYTRNANPAGATRLGDNAAADGVEAYHRRVDLDRTWAVIDQLAAIAADRETTSATIALAWLLSRPAVTSLILGARTTEQLVANLGAGEMTLSGEELRLLDEASDPHPADYPYGQPGRDQRSRPMN